MNPTSAPVPPQLPDTPSLGSGETAPLSEAGRLAGVFFSPGKAFADIARRPRWWVPLVLSAILSIIYVNAFSRVVGWESMTRSSIERMPQAQSMTPQQQEQAIATSAKAYSFLGYGGSAIGPLVYNFIVAVVLMFIFDTILSAGVGLKRMMVIVAYGSLPMLIYTTLAMVVLFLKNPEDFNFQNPLMFNLGAFLSTDTPAALRALGSSLDLFTLWVMILLAIGISSAARRISFGKALAGVAFPWALYVCLKAAAAAAGISPG